MNVTLQSQKPKSQFVHLANCFRAEQQQQQQQKLVRCKALVPFFFVVVVGWNMTGNLFKA
jgi:hypothetical protein